jgi:hypothetical protein
LLKQLSDQITLPSTPRAQVASNAAPANPFEEGFQRGNLEPDLGGPQQQQPPQQQLARLNASNIDNPVVKLAGLILGSPEFQRQ